MTDYEIIADWLNAFSSIVNEEYPPAEVTDALDRMQAENAAQVAEIRLLKEQISRYLQDRDNLHKERDALKALTEAWRTYNRTVPSVGFGPARDALLALGEKPDEGAP